MHSSSFSCPLCGHLESVPMEVAEAPGIYQCATCSFIFAPDIHSEDASLYDSNFGDTNVHPTFEKRDGQFVGRNIPRLNALLDRVEPFRKTGAILDVGCSAAFFLQQAKLRGWRPQGVEIASWAVEFSRSELGLDVFRGFLQDAKFPDNTFDVIFSSHVMEHIGDPLALLKEMARVLRPGGVHVTVVPTQFSSPSWRLAKRFTGDPPPIHASFYTHRTYSAFLEKAGLKVVDLEYNVELSRLRDLLRSKEGALQAWRDGKKAVVQGGGSSSAKGWVTPLKKVLNWIGTQVGSGDEMRVMAVKREH